MLSSKLIKNFDERFLFSHSCFLQKIGVIFFISFLFVYQANAQMGYVTIYSDATVYADEESIGGTIVGMGSTDDYYNSYGHTYSVETSIYSPNGSTTSGTGLPAWASASIIDSTGNYYVNSYHFFDCPNSPGNTMLLGVTSTTLSSAYNVSLFKYNDVEMVDWSFFGWWKKTCNYRNCKTSSTDECWKEFKSVTEWLYYNNDSCYSGYQSTYVRVHAGFLSWCSLIATTPLPYSPC